MIESKFKAGDRVIISQTPVDVSDKRYAGKTGVVESLSHRNGNMDVYRVKLDEADYPSSFYNLDLLPYDELEALRAELVEAEAKVVSVKAAIKVKERNATDLPIATVVAYKDTYGPAAITKQSENVWLNIYPTNNGNPTSERLYDSKVTQLLMNNADAVVRKP